MSKTRKKYLNKPGEWPKFKMAFPGFLVSWMTFVIMQV